MEEIPVLRSNGLHSILGVINWIDDAQQTGEIPSFAHGLVDGRRDLLALLPLGNIGFDLILNECSDFFTEGGVSLVVVGGVELFKHQR